MFKPSERARKFLLLGLVMIVLFVALTAAGGPLFTASAHSLAATSPSLGALLGYSVLGGGSVTCTGATTTSGAVGVSPGSSITGFPVPCNAGGGTHSSDTSANNAQAEALTVFGALAQDCTNNYPSGQDLSLISPLGPGVYCSGGSFLLTKNLTLTGSGVWIFRTVSTLITSPGSSVTGGDPCNVWWRIGSSTTLDTSTSFIGNVFSQNGANAMNTGARLNGRFLALSAATVTLDSNTISGPACAVASTTQTPLPVTQTVIGLIKTATAFALLQTPRPGGGNQVTSTPVAVSVATAAPTATVPTVLPTTGGSDSSSLVIMGFALVSAAAALVGFSLLSRRRT